MTKDEFFARVMADANSRIFHGELNSSALKALCIVEIRARLRDLTAMLPKDHETLNGTLSEITAALEQCEGLLAEDRGAHDYHCAQLRQSLKTNLEGLNVVEQKCERHPINDPAVRQQVLSMTGGVCTYCAVPLTDGQPVEGQSTKLFVEHVVPSSKGGPDNIVNYVPSCGSCNSAKGDRHVLHFVRKVMLTRGATVIPIKTASEGDR